jgi:hypothetical protein
MLQKQGGWENGADLNFKLFQARFLIGRSAGMNNAGLCRLGTVVDECV